MSFASVSLGWSQTLPQGAQVIQGAVSVSQSGSQMAITQSTPKAVVNWQSFDIGQNAKVNITQPSSQSVLLNRVLSDNPTQILGQLQANGQIVLVNPKGIVVGSDGSVSASAFTASTLNISDADFMAGQYRYTRDGSTGQVINKGRINVAPGGYVALLGASVSNEGQIIAPQGGVALGAAETITVPVGRTGKIKLELTPASINASVANQKNGVIVVEGGQVYMQAAAMGPAVATLLNSGSIDTSGVQAGAVHLLADGGQIVVDGSITANSTGRDDQGLTLKGGDIIIGRDTDTGVLAKASDVSGAILESKQGFVETSGDYLKTDGVRVYAAEWLLDPTNITIAASGASGTAYAATYTAGADSVILASDINASLNAGTGVTIATSATGASAGNIAINESISKTAGTFANLTLRAHNDITLAAGKTITSTSGNLNVTLNSDFDASGAGAIVMNSGSGITSNGGNISLGGGSAGSAASYATGNSTNPNGILLEGASLLSNGGNITLRGKSTSDSTLYDYRSNGIRLRDASGNNVINAGTGQIAMYGISASTGTDAAYGIEISQYGTPTYSTQLTSSNSSSAILLDGTGSTTSSSAFRSGVYINAKGTVSATGNGGVTINATSGGSGEALALLNGSSINTSSANASVTVSADSVSIGPTASINAGTGTVTIQNRTAGTLINVGGADVLTGSPLTLGVSNAELNRITAATTKVGSTTAGNLVVSTALTTAAATGNLYLQTNGTATVNTSSAVASGAGLFIQTTGGNITNNSAISGTNITLDNTNGTINTSTGVITAGASTNATTTAITTNANITATGNINIQGNRSTNATGVNLAATGAITSSGTAATINIGSNYSIANAAAIKATGTTGTGANINLTATGGTITGAGAIGDTTNKNASVTFTQAGTSTYSGAINAANFTKAGAGSLTLDSWLATPSVATNVSNAYTVNAGSLTLAPGGTYAQLNPASVNVVNASTFALSPASNGRWNNTAFNFTGGLGGGTMDLGGNPIGASGTTNTFSTSGGATNTITGMFNANSATVNMNLTSATSGTTLLDGSFAALAFTQNSQGGFGLQNGGTVNVSGGGHLLIKDKVGATAFNINAGNVQVGDGTAATASATATLDVTNLSIAAGSKLTFNRAEAYSNASVITGTGSLIQAGTGVVTLTGNSNAFAGASTVNAGKTLAIGTGGSLGAAGSTLALTDATSTLSFTNTSGTSTVASTISGLGKVTENGTGGTGVLTANNTYSGITTVTAGTLQIGNGGATGTLGSGSVTNNAALVLNRDASSDLTVSAVISGTGTLTQAGVGKSILTGANTYTGATSVNAGTLSLGTTATTGTASQQYASSQFTIAAGATLDFNAPTGVTLDNRGTILTGAGTITKTGGGTLQWNVINDTTFNMLAGSLIDVKEGTFIGSTNYHGKWTNNLSSLNVASGASFTGSEGDTRVDALTGAGAVSFGWTTIGSLTLGVNNTAAGTYNTTAGTATFSGVLSGPAPLNKIGTGTQILTGTNTYSGATNISAGTLKVGNGGATGTLGSGAVTVTSPALLDINRTGAYSLSTVAAGGVSGTGNVTLTGNNTITVDRSIALTGGSSTLTATSTAGATNTSFIFGNTTLSANTLNFTGTGAGKLNGSTTVNIGLTGGTSNLNFTSSNYYGFYGSNNATTINTTGAVNITGTYTGTNSIYGGVGLGGTLANTGGQLTLTADASTSSGRVGFENGVTGSYSGNLKVSGNVAITGTAGSSSSFNGGLRDIGLGAINATGNSTLTLTGNKYGVVLGGAVTETATKVLNLNVTNSGTQGVVYNNAAAISITGALALSSVNNVYATGALSAAGGISVNAANTSAITGVISGNGSLTKTGAGTLVLTANNTYTGSTAVTDGTLNVGNTVSFTNGLNAPVTLGSTGGTTGTLGTGGAVTLSNNANLSFVRSAATTIANNISGTGNVSASITGAASTLAVSSPINLTGGTVNLAADNNITVTAPIATTNATSSAVLLDAGKSTNAGTSTGGDITFSGTGTVSVGTGGRATLMTGSLSGSTGLTTLVGAGSGNFRYNSDETTTNYSTVTNPLGSGLYGIYREAPVITATLNSVVKTYDGLTYSGGNGLATGFSGLLNGESAQLGTITYGGTSQGAKNANTYALSGTASSGLGYAVSLTAGTLTINKANLMQITAAKTYDGSTTVTAAQMTTIQGVNGETFTASAGTASISDKNVAYANNTLTNISGLTLNGVNGALTSNYNLESSSLPAAGVNNSVSITKANLTQVAAAKTYDGLSTVTGTQMTAIAGINSETFTASGGTAVINDKNVATANKTLTDLSGLTLGSVNGGLISNYNFSSNLPAAGTNNAVTITALALTPSITASDKTYDQTNAATLTNQTITGVISGDTVSLSAGSTNTFASADVARNNSGNVTSQTVSASGLSLSGAQASNYALTSTTATTSATINPKLVTVAITASDKTYDQTATATVTRTTSDIFSSDAANVTMGSTSNTFASADVARSSGVVTSQTVTSLGLSLTGTKAGNYALTNATATTTATISPKSLTASVTASDKTYDKSNTATITGHTSSDIIAGDAVTLSSTSDTFASANVARDGLGNVISQTVTASGLTLAGAQAGNYTLTNINAIATTTATINPKTVSLTATKTYDGNTALTGSQLVLGDLLSGDSLSFTGATLNDKNVVGAAYVNAVTLVNSGTTLASNYQAPVLTAASTGNTASVTPAALAANLTGTVSKVYDATTNATLSGSNFNVTGWVSTEGASVTQTAGTYASANVDVNGGSGAVSATLATNQFTANSGTLLSNYTLPTSASGNVGTITPAALSVNVGNTSAFVTQNANTAIDTGLSYTGLKGTDAASAALVTVPTAANRTYTGTSATPTVGNYSAVYGLDFTPTAHHGNYTVTVQKGNLQVVAADKLIVTVASQNDTYGNRTASTAGQASNVTAQYCFVATNCNGANLYNIAMAAGSGSQWSGTDNTGTTVSMTTTVATSNLSGGGFIKAGNYNWDVANLSATAATPYNGYVVNSGTLTVNKLDITPTASNVSKVYDGTMSAAGVTLNILQAKNGDTVSALAGSGTYTTKSVVSNDAVTFGSLTLSGADKDNYALAVSSVQGTGSITPANLTVTATAVTKTYDGTTSTTGLGSVGTPLAGSGDSVNSPGSQSYTSKTVGNGKTVQASGVTIKDGSGADMTGNYTITYVDNTTSVINQANLTVTATQVAKTYDGTTTATGAGSVGTLAGAAANESVNSAGTQAFTDKNFGLSNKTVTASGVTIKDSNNADVTGNYIIAYVDNTTSTINKADLTVTAQAVTKVYDGTTSASGNGLVGTLAGAAANETVSSAGTQAFLDKNAGAGNKTLQASGVTIKDASNADVTGNYNLTYVNNTASTITPAALAASLTGTVSKVYDATTNATLSAGNFNLTGWVSGEGASVTQAAGTYASANVNVNSGTGAVSATLATSQFTANSGTLMSNYTLPTSASGNVGTITPAALRVNVGNTKAFVTQNASTAIDTGVSYTGLQGADTAATALVQVPVAANRTYTGASTPAVGNYSAVYGLSFTPTAQNGNYTITVQKGDLEVVPANHILITVPSQSVTYGIRTASMAGQASNVTAQYCFVATDCNGANLYSLAMTAGTGNTWTALDNAGATVSMETTVTTAGNLSTSGYLKAGNYTYGVTNVASSPTTPYSGVTINGGTLTVDKLSLSPTTTNVSKVYDASTLAAGVILNLAAVKSGDAVTATATSGTYTTKNVVTNDTVTFGGLSLSGVDQGNYALAASSVQTTGAITPRTLTLQAISGSKTYDGATSSTGTVTVSGLAPSSIDSVTSLTQAFASKNVLGTNGSTLNVNSGYTVNDGNSGNNYTVSSQSANGTITPKSLSLAAVTATKIYDGTTTSAASVAVTGIADNSGDTVTGLSQAFGSKNVLGTDGSTLSVNSGYAVNDGNLGGNYTVATSTAAGTITPKALTLAAATDTKTYDGTTSSLASVVVSGIASGSGDTVSGQSQSFGSKNVLGTGGSTLSVNSGYTVNDGNSSRNYSVTTTTAAGTITAKALTLTAVSDSKTYDGTTTSSGTVAISGLAYGSTDSVTAVQSFGSKNVLGTNVSTLSVNSGYTVSDGHSGNNYTVTTQSVNGTITPKALTLAAATDTKTYDGTTNSSVSVAVSGIAANSGDTVTGLSQAFGSKNALGTNGSTLTVGTGYTVNDGNSGRNYSVGTTGSTGTINKANLAVTATQVSKTYDGSVDATGNGTVGSLAGANDSVNSQGAQVFLDANAGTGKTVRASGVTIKDTNSQDMTGNYNILYADNTASVINKANLTITANADARFVTQTDATNFNGVNYSGWVGGESSAVLSGTLAIARTNASTNVAAGSYPGSLVPSGLTSGNYTIGFANGNYTIVPANQLLIRTTNMSTTYGTTPTYSTTAQYLDGTNVINTLSRSVSGNITTFIDNAGGSVNVKLRAYSGNTPAGVSSSGNTVVGNYLIEDKSPLITGANFLGAPVFVGNLSVNQKSVTPTVSGLTKVYDGTTALANTALILTGQVTGDTLLISGSGVFNSKNAGTQRGYAFNNLALSGADQGNYFLSGGNSLTGVNGTITPAPLRLTTTNVTKTYDGTLSAAGTATVVGGTQLFGQDSISGGSFAFTHKNAGTGNKTVTTSAVTVTDGNNGGNYAVSYVDNTASTINTAALIVTAAASQKTYDGSLSASGTGVVGTLAGAGDSVANAGSLSFTDKNAGTGKTVTVTGVQIKDSSGADMTGNYAITSASSNSGVITPANASISEASKTVTYNGANQTQDAPTLSGFLAGDNIQASGAASGRNAGTYSSNLVATGTDVGNYNITYVNAPLVINKLGASITATGTSVVYNGQTQTQGAATLSGFIAGDSVAATGLASGRNVGAYNSGLGATGADAGNYTIQFLNAPLTITQRAASLGAANQTVVYNGTVQTLLGTQGSGFIAGDALVFTGLPSGRNVGQYTAALGVTGADASNYSITYGNGVLTIGKAPLQFIGTAVADKTYDGNTTAKVTAGSILGLMGNETLNVVSVTGAFADPEVGNGKPVQVIYGLADGLQGGLVSNYDGSPQTLSASITRPSAPTQSVRTPEVDRSVGRFSRIAYLGFGGLSGVGAATGQMLYTRPAPPTQACTPRNLENCVCEPLQDQTQVLEATTVLEVCRPLSVSQLTRP